MIAGVVDVDGWNGKMDEELMVERMVAEETETRANL